MLGRVITGERFKPTAANWNELVTGAVAGRDARGAGARGIPAQSAAPATVLVRNGSATAIPRNGVMSLASATSPFTSDALVESPILTGGIPTDSGEPFAIVLEPLPFNGSIGLAAVAGVVPCLVSVSDEAHAFATTQASASALASSTSGVPIIWKESGTGTKWALVLLGTGNASTGSVGGIVGSSAQFYVDTTIASTGFGIPADSINFDDAEYIEESEDFTTILRAPASGIYLVGANLLFGVNEEPSDEYHPNYTQLKLYKNGLGDVMLTCAGLPNPDPDTSFVESWNPQLFSLNFTTALQLIEDEFVFIFGEIAQQDGSVGHAGDMSGDVWITRIR